MKIEKFIIKDFCFYVFMKVNFLSGINLIIG